MLNVGRSRFLEWRNTAVEERAVMLGRTANLLRERQHEYARLMTEEMESPSGRA